MITILLIVKALVISVVVILALLFALTEIAPPEVINRWTYQLERWTAKINARTAAIKAAREAEEREEEY